MPGFWTPAALGLLLSVTRAAGLDVRGLVDAAVAGACFAPRHPRLLHLDLTRHRAVLTTLDGHDGTRSPARWRTSRAWAPRPSTPPSPTTSTRRFVAETRYDPRHSGAAEQALHDAIPGWLPGPPQPPFLPGRPHRGRPRAPDRDHPRGLRSRGNGPSRAPAGAGAGASRGRTAAAALRPRGARRRASSPTCATVSGLEVFELPHDAAVLAALRHHARIRHDGRRAALRHAPARLGPRAGLEAGPGPSRGPPAHAPGERRASRTSWPPTASPSARLPRPAGAASACAARGSPRTTARCVCADGDVVLEDHAAGVPRC